MLKTPQLARIKFVVIIILLISILFRFTNLDQKVYWVDEVHTSLRASGYTRNDFIEQIPKNQVIGIEDLQRFQCIRPNTGLPETIKALKSAEHSPLYYLMARFSLELFNCSPTTTRGLAAVISLLEYPLIYWLSLELFSSPLTAWLSVALLAVSPFHLLYAQEAREYSLLTVAILFSSAAILWSIRQKTPLSWGIYCLSVIFGLYTHPVIGLVFIGHGIYVLVIEKCKFTKNFKRYLIASITGLIAFIPWILVFIFNDDGVNWVNRSIPLVILIQRWLLNLNALFFDVQVLQEQPLFNISTGQDQYLLNNYLVLIFIIPIFILVKYSLYFLLRNTEPKIWLFLFLLMGVTSLTLVLPDLISGGQRSTILRYLIASGLGIQLTVSYLLSRKIETGKFIWKWITAIILSLGIICSFVIINQETWWNKYSSYYKYEIARIINKSQSPLVITNSERVSRLTSLSYHLEQKTKFIVISRDESIDLPQNFRDIFLFKPYPELIEQLQDNPDYQVEMINNDYELWKVNSP
jgi:uncharacterized membrane protein